MTTNVLSLYAIPFHSIPAETDQGKTSSKNLRVAISNSPRKLYTEISKVKKKKTRYPTKLSLIYIYNKTLKTINAPRG